MINVGDYAEYFIGKQVINQFMPVGFFDHDVLPI